MLAVASCVANFLIDHTVPDKVVIPPVITGLALSIFFHCMIASRCATLERSCCGVSKCHKCGLAQAAECKVGRIRPVPLGELSLRVGDAHKVIHA